MAARNTQTLRVSIVGDARNLNQALEGVQGRVQQFGAGMRTVGRNLTRRLTMPIVGMGAAVLKVAGDFQSSMNRVGALTGATGRDFEQLNEQAKELGRTTAFSASQAADGMGFLAQAGFETNEILAAMPSTLALAAAGQLELATAADIASNVLQGFGLAAEEVERVNDVLAATSASANTSVEQLGEGLSYAAPIANAAGYEIEQVSAIIGSLSDAGIQGSRAGTTLVGVIAALEDASGPARDAFEEMGLATHDAAGELRPMADIIEDLEGIGLSAGESLDIFGRRAGPGMSALLEIGSDAIREMDESLADAGGRAQEIADRQMEGLTGALARMRSALEGVAIAIAESGLLDWAAGMAERFAGMFSRLADLNPSMLRIGVAIAAIAAAAGPLLWIGGALIGMFAGLLSPVGLVVGAVGALTIALGVAYARSEEFRDIVNGAFEAVRNVVGPVIGWLGDRLSDVGRWFGFTRETVAEEVAGMSNEAVGEVVDMTQQMTDELARLARDGESLSKEMADDWIGNVERMRDDSIAAANEQFEEQRATYLALADDLETIDGEMTASALRQARERRDETIATAEEQADRVLRQLEYLRDSGVEVTEAMKNNIVSQMEDQRDGVIMALVDQAEHGENVLARLAAESGKISLEMASTAIAESARQRDETIAAANEEYEERVAAILQMQRDSDDFTQEMAENAIAEAREQRDESIGAARDMHGGVVAEVEGMREGVTGEVNTMTGEVLSSFDRIKMSAITDGAKFAAALTEVAGPAATKFAIWVKTDFAESAGNIRDFAVDAATTLFGFRDTVREVQQAAAEWWRGGLDDMGAAVGRFAGRTREGLNEIIGFLNRLISRWNNFELTMPGRSISMGPLGEVSFGGFSIGTPNIPSIPVLHGGGVFRAPTPGGEGFAFLRDREVVTTPESANDQITVLRAIEQLLEIIATRPVPAVVDGAGVATSQRFRDADDRIRDRRGRNTGGAAA